MLKLLKKIFGTSSQSNASEAEFVDPKIKGFKYQINSVPSKTGEIVSWHDISATVTAEDNQEKTLEKSWILVRDLAKHLKTIIKDGSPVNSFRIIVGWSKETREQQGQIFKIWQSNEELDIIISCELLSDYQNLTEHKYYIPFKGWQRDVFQDKQNKA